MGAADRAVAAAAIAGQPTSRLQDALDELDALPELDDAQQLARSWISCEIERRRVHGGLRLVVDNTGPTSRTER